MNNEYTGSPDDIIREASPMISDSGETSSERGGMLMQALAAASATTSNDRSSSYKAVIVHEDDADIYIPSQNSKSSGSGSGRPPATTVNGRSPRLQGQTGALLNRADPLSLSGSGPTTALNIMRRSGGRSNSDTTSGSGGASHNQDGGVPRSVVTSMVSPPSSVTPVISNVDARGGNNRAQNSNSGMPPPTATMDYQRSQMTGLGPGGGGGYPQYTNAHDIHRARWEQEQRELAADYYPSASNYPFDYYNSSGSMGMYYQQQLNQPPPASLRYHRQQQMPAETTNAAAADRLVMEHRLQVEQRLQQEFYQPRVPQQLPPSMIVLPHQAQAAQLQQSQQQLQAGQDDGGGANNDSKAPTRSSSPGVSSAHRNQVHQQLQRSGSPGISSGYRNQVHQQLQQSGSPGVPSVQRSHRRTHSQQQQQQPPHVYEERDWRTNQVWREDDHSHTASLGGLKIPTPPPPAIYATERGTSDNKASAGLPTAKIPPRMSQQQPSQQQGRVSTIDQYDITHAQQMYGQYVQDLQQQQQPRPSHASATPSPPPAPMPPTSTPMMTGIDPRIQHQMNLMAMMFQHQQQGGGIPPPHMSPLPRGLMYPPQYYAPQHNFYQGGGGGAVSQQHPPMPKEVIVPSPLVAEADRAADGVAADSTVPSPYHGPEPAVAPPPMLREKSSKTKVTFSTLQIRTYETVLGDNPSCTGGPPLSIGWRYNPDHYDSTVDEYERKQDELYGGPEIRPLDIDLVLHRSERESILMKMGYTQQDLAEAVRRLNKAKSKRRQTVHNLPVTFLEEKAESFKRSVGRLFLNRQRTRHMYDDWKKGDKGAPKERRRNSV